MLIQNLTNMAGPYRSIQKGSFVKREEARDFQEGRFQSNIDIPKIHRVETSPIGAAAFDKDDNIILTGRKEVFEAWGNQIKEERDSGKLYSRQIEWPIDKWPTGGDHFKASGLIKSVCSHIDNSIENLDLTKNTMTDTDQALDTIIGLATIARERGTIIQGLKKELSVTREKNGDQLRLIREQQERSYMNDSENKVLHERENETKKFIQHLINRGTLKGALLKRAQQLLK